MATYVPAKIGVQYIFTAGLVSQADTRLIQTNPTIASGDFKVSIDNGALANLNTLPAVTPSGSKMVKFTLSTSEMNGANITIVCSDAAGAEWCDAVFNIQTAARQIDDLAYPATSGRSMVVDASGLVDANTVKVGPTGSGTTQTARDIGASVLLSSGTGTGQLKLAAGYVAMTWADIAAPTTTVSLSGTTVATVTTTTTATNLTNAATAGDFTATMKTSIGTAVAASAVASVTGNVGGNVTGSVGSVVGAVGSVTGAVGSVTGNVGGNVTGSVGSVVGNVGGNVTGSVGSVTGLNAALLDIAVSSRLASASYTAPNNAGIASILGYTGEVWAIYGLDIANPMTVTPTTRAAGTISQAISGNGTSTTTVTRL